MKKIIVVTSVFVLSCFASSYSMDRCDIGDVKRRVAEIEHNKAVVKNTKSILCVIEGLRHIAAVRKVINAQSAFRAKVVYEDYQRRQEFKKLRIIKRCCPHCS